jgi:CubicO group peptidase (beta-lactamase class C family)
VKRLLATIATLATLTAPVAGCTDGTGTDGSGTDDDASAQAAVDAQGAGGAGSCTPELDEAFTAWAQVGFSGTVAISTRGEFDCLAAYGTADAAAGTPNTVATVFAIGSVSKAVTAAAVFALVDDGALALSDRAGDLVPGLGGPVAGVTVEQLLLHTSGLTGDHGEDHQPLDREAAVAAIGGLGQAFAPGTAYLYSNAGYTLLAVIVEEVSGVGYREFMASRVLTLPGGTVAGGFWDGDPAAAGPRAIGVLDDGGRGQAGDFPGPHWALAGNGDLAMTARDLAAWTHALFTGRVVSPDAAAALAAPTFDHGDGTAETPGWVALDASAFGEPVVASSGGGGDTGHNAVVAWLPDSERVIALASNTPEVTAEDLVQAVGPALVAGDELPRPDGPSGDVDPAEMAALEGTYSLSTGGRFEVAAHEDGLAVTAAGPGAVSALFPLPDGVTPDDAAAHEARVEELLAGDTEEGREELAALEADFGPIGDIELVGTIVDGGELRTYVTVTAGGEPLIGWYALDEAGGIAAVDVGDRGPTLVVAPAGDGAFRPVDPTGGAGAGGEVTIGFGDGRLTVTGPAGSTDARLSG